MNDEKGIWLGCSLFLVIFFQLVMIFELVAIKQLLGG